MLFYLVDPNRFKSLLDGNGSIILSGMPYQIFVSLIGTYGMGSDPLVVRDFYPHQHVHGNYVG